MNATAALWTPIEFEDDDNDIDDLWTDTVPISAAVPVRRDPARQSRRVFCPSPLERGLEECATRDGSTLVVEDDSPSGFFELEAAGEIDMLELVVTRSDRAPVTQKRARLELKIKKPANNNRGFR